MTSRKELFAKVKHEVIIGVVREDSPEAALSVAHAYAENGVRLLEITLTTPDAISILAKLVEEYGDKGISFAAGTVRTVTEILAAWQAGCDIVKVYPAQMLGGPDYFRTIRQPIRDVPMLAGGPVPLDTIEPYLDAGAIAVNLGGSLAVPDLVKTRQWEEIGRRVLLATSIIESRRSALAETVYVH
jgi:2-dehydro-3-deoxyphosphogluconate aldolase/(4S)-4-hydroxy-2-oxoglutarate aldolase